jgi:Thioesterase-like superfamily
VRRVVTPADIAFDSATAIRPTGDPLVSEVDVHPLWTVGDKPNGGYLLALLGRAARAAGRGETGVEWEVTSSSVTYVLPPHPGPASVRTTVLRRGRSAAQVRAVLVQDGADTVDAVFVVSDIPPVSRVRYDGIEPLEVAEPEDCVRLAPKTPTGLVVGMLEATELRMDPRTLPYSGPAAEGARAELRGWTRFVDGREAEPLALLFFVDAVPPATLMIGSSGWVPTLQMSVYVRARPEPGWLGLRFTGNLVADGVVDETCVLWDSGGRIVAQATQLARLRFPDET